MKDSYIKEYKEMRKDLPLMQPRQQKISRAANSSFDTLIKQALK
jgi:hypothetical protein